MAYPRDDNDFEEVTLTKVEHGDGWWTINHGVVGFVFNEDPPVDPKAGMTARFYPGAGPGMRVRGLYLDGQRVFYRTEAEDKERAEVEMYGADAADLLGRWDEGRSVWTVEMGGLGPGYEQALQIAMFEMLRVMLAEQTDLDDLEDESKRDEFCNRMYTLPNLAGLGLSGAQVGAALHLACQLYRKGPRQCFAEVPDRKTQVSRNWPQAPEPGMRGE